MKKKLKSSITLPPEELRLVQQLKRRVGAKSYVEVIRRSLSLLRETTDREYLRAAYQKSVDDLKDVTLEEMAELDHLSEEGLEEE